MNPIPIRHPLTRFRRALPCLGLAALGLGAGPLPAATDLAHDFFICANLNRNYVIGAAVVATNGLFRHDPATREWQHLGYNDATISAVAFAPDDRRVIYTTSLNGIWRSGDGGDTWRMTNSWDMTEGRDVAVDPHAPDMVYLALPDGVAVSVDRGVTWQRRESGLPDRGKYTQTIEVDRMRRDRVLAGCEKGVFLSTDAGGQWRQVLPTTTTVNDLEQSPHDPDHWMAVTDTHGIWTSINGAETWSQLAALPADEAIYNVAFDPTDARRLAVAGWAHGVWVSENGGATWQERNLGLPAGARAWRVGVDPNTGRLYAAIHQETLYHSDDFGRTWQPDALAVSTVSAFHSVSRILPAR